jgi:catechol 2,3-dioxygenase-like lactoylglutathione lyase family enzyme
MALPSRHGVTVLLGKLLRDFAFFLEIYIFTECGRRQTAVTTERGDMTGIKIEDIAFVGFRAPDLSKMRSFMEDFGAIVVRQDDQQLFMRGCGEAPFLHMTELGDPAFLMVGFRAGSLEDLDRLARQEGLQPLASDAPGGGMFIDLRDPDGHQVRVVAGQVDAQRIPFGDPAAWNFASARPRLSSAKRTEEGPAKIVRLGHCVLSVSDFRASEAWYKARFGFITSDEIEAAPGVAVGAFMRCDRGDIPTDHHTLFLLQAPTGPGFNHAAFEVRDIEDLLAGHARLLDQKRDLSWGVGRHYLGSQVFDYWRDPWGHTLEHWTDGDLFTAADGSNTATVAELVGVQWGPAFPGHL